MSLFGKDVVVIVAGLTDDKSFLKAVRNKLHIINAAKKSEDTYDHLGSFRHESGKVAGFSWVVLGTLYLHKFWLDTASFPYLS